MLQAEESLKGGLGASGVGGGETGYGGDDGGGSLVSKEEESRVHDVVMASREEGYWKLV